MFRTLFRIASFALVGAAFPALGAALAPPEAPPGFIPARNAGAPCARGFRRFKIPYLSYRRNFLPLFQGVRNISDAL